jgi:outer membrane protein, multidrug efflux system
MRKFFPLIPTVGAALVMLSACTMIPKYSRPDAPVPSRFPGGGNASGNAAEIRWREAFTDPRLRRYIEIALENNRDLRVAVLNVEQARAQYRIQRSSFFPQISTTGAFTRTRAAGDTSRRSSSGNSSTSSTSVSDAASGGDFTSTAGASAATTVNNGSTSNAYSVSVGTTAYEVDLFGRVRSLNRNALETYFATAENRRNAQLSLVAQVATQYLTLREQEEQLALARQTLTAVQKSYELNKRQFDVGTSSELDLRTAEAQVQTAEVNAIGFERLAAQAANYLALLIGQPLPADVPSKRPLKDRGIVAEVPAGLPADLIQRRPDILAAEHTLLAANANIGAARAAFFPTISLTTSGGYQSVAFSNLFSNAARVWSFAPQITVPIFTGGQNLANLDVAKINKRIEIANYEKAIQTAFREVADALAGRSTYDRELRAQEALVAAQQRRYELSDLRYRQGVDSYTNVLLAQQDLYTAQRSLVTTRTDRLANLVTLYKALGGGWR